MKKLKRFLAAFALVACLGIAHAQGTFHFTVNLSGLNEVPPNGSPYDGHGFFDWDGTTLNYGVQVFSPSPRPTGAFIHGPAGPGMNAPMIFDLGTPIFDVPFPPTDRGGWAYLGGIQNLTSSQISDLFAGRWYVNITSTDYPGGEWRGQIALVPEPSSLVLLFMGLAGGCLLRRRAW
jgi:hypothetical protein